MEGDEWISRCAMGVGENQMETASMPSSRLPARQDRRMIQRGKGREAGKGAKACEGS